MFHTCYETCVAAFSVRVLHHHLVCAHTAKLHKCISACQAWVSHPEFKLLLRLTQAFDNVTSSSSAQARAQKIIIISRHRGAVEGDLKSVEIVKAKEAWITEQGQRSNMKGAAEIQGYSGGSQHVYDEVRLWVITCQVPLSCLVLMWLLCCGVIELLKP